MAGWRSSRSPEHAARTEHVGQRIRARRLELGLTQIELAKILHLSFQQIQKYEWGKDDVRVARLLDLADALRTRPAYFIPNGREHDTRYHDWESDPRLFAECLALWT